MAISKEIELDNGVVVRYHRVTAVYCTTNVQNDIFVTSYTSESKRESERDGGDAYMHSSCYVLPYQQGMSVEDAYAWLKENVPEFEGATDVWEEGQQEAAGQ